MKVICISEYELGESSFKALFIVLLMFLDIILRGSLHLFSQFFTGEEWGRRVEER